MSTPAMSTRPSLSRIPTTSSYHAQNSLRRMATHETGELANHDEDDSAEALHTHDEHEDEHESHTHNTHDEEANIGVQPNSQTEKVEKVKKEVELQDQTNLLPIRQVIFVFIGLTCALFCSLLDQTIVTTALPTLGRVFNRSDIAPWVGTAYLLTSTVSRSRLDQDLRLMKGRRCNRYMEDCRISLGESLS